MVGEESAMPYANADALVSTEWLAAHLDAPDLRIVDGTFTLPGVKPTGRELYDARHIPGAVFFDIDEIADEHNPLPHMLPSPEKFAARMRKLGLGDGHKIVVYDSAGLSSAGRPWWMLRVFGHRDVAILDGGLPKWEAEGRAVTEEVPLPRERHFTARLNTLLVRDKGQLLDNLTKPREQVIDARSRRRGSSAARLSSPAAARASPPAHWPSASTSSAGRRPPFTMARGRNGACQ